MPTIAAYRGESTLYLFDSGAGPEQRAALLRVAQQLGGAEEVVLLNSHGHIDHLGNNDVLADIAAARRRHLFPRTARPGLDPQAFFSRMYQRGVPYFDYLTGLSVDPAAVASMLRAVGADPGLTDADVADLGKRITELGITPALGKFVPSLLVDLLLHTYPAVYPSIETIEDYEDLAPAGSVRIGATEWRGWSFNGGEVNVLLSEGHSAGGVVFHVPEHRFLMMAGRDHVDPDLGGQRPAQRRRHRPPRSGDDGRGRPRGAGRGTPPAVAGARRRGAGLLRGIVGGAAQFADAVDTALRRRPDGVTSTTWPRTSPRPRSRARSSPCCYGCSSRCSRRSSS